jgi:Predicted acetyltransferase
VQITIREAKVDDYLSIGNLIKNELGYQELDFGELFIRLQKMKSDDKHLTIVAESEDTIIGFIGFYKGIAYNYDGEYIQIIALAVAEEHQNKGIGSKLLRWVEDYAIQHGIRSFGVNSGLKRAEAHAFYEHNGYLKKSYGFVKEI